MLFWLGVELAPPTLNIWLGHFQKLNSPGLLLFLKALAEVELEVRSGDTDFLACWREEDEVPFFLVLGDGINGEIIPESGQ